MVARDLLDHVDLARRVGTERRHLDEQAVTFGHRGEADRREVGGDPGGLERRAEQGVHPGGADVDPGGLTPHRPVLDDARGDGRRGDPGRRGGERDELADAVRGPHDPFGVDPALEALGGLAAQPEALRGAADETGGELGRLQEDPGGRRPDLARRAAHHAGHADRCVVRVADQAVLDLDLPPGGVTGDPERPLDPVEGDDPLPRSGEAHHDAVAAETVEVVGVGGLAELEHDVVRGVDDRADRPHPGQHEAPGDLGRRGQRGDADEDAADELLAGLRRRHRDRGELADGPPGLVDDGLGDRERQAQARREVPGHPGDREAVGPVRLDLEVEDGVGDDAEVLGEGLAGLHGTGQRGPGGAGRGQHHQSLRVVGEAELAPGAEHPLRHGAAHRAARDDHAVRQLGPDGRERHDVALDEVPRPADDLQRVGAAGVHDDLADAVRAGDGPDLLDAGQHDAVEAAADVLHALDDEPERVEGLAERAHRRPVAHVGRDRRELPQPRKRYVHGPLRLPAAASRGDSVRSGACARRAPGLRCAQNCVRKRTSFSRRLRMSSIS